MEVEENNTSTSEEKTQSQTTTTAPTNTTTNQTEEMETVPPESTATQVLEIRDPATRPVFLLSVKLIDTYKGINKIYYEAKAKRLREQQTGNTRGGVYNDGYDDQNYDYLIHGDEIFAERYILKHRIGKGSFGQVVCAYDRQQQCDVAIKIIKSKHAFAVQARTEIKLLELTLEKDFNDEHNVVRLLDTFVFRKHQCLVFEMLSYNLYELLKNTKFRGVSLALVRKFAKQILRGLDFLSRKDVDIIHCDLKPENILLRHPKRSAIKIIDFGSSCLSNKKMYTYIQSRFYRSPEVLLGLPYSQKIDIWSLGCVLVEMHTGEPLFGGVDQLDQLNRIVNILGMVPAEMVEKSPEETRKIFFDVVDDTKPVPPERANFTVTITDKSSGLPVQLVMKLPKGSDGNTWKAISGKTLEDVIGVTTGGPQGRRKDDVGHSEEIYRLFADFIRSMLIYQPEERTSAKDALTHPYLSVNIEFPAVQSANSSTSTSSSQKEGEKSEQAPKPVQTAIGSIVPRRRSRSAPRRLTGADDFSITLSSQNVEGSIYAPMDAPGAPTKHSKKKLITGEKITSNEQANEMVVDESHVDNHVTADSSNDVTEVKLSQQVSQSDDGPMETSEVDDEGNITHQQSIMSSTGSSQI